MACAAKINARRRGLAAAPGGAVTLMRPGIVGLWLAAIGVPVAFILRFWPVDAGLIPPMDTGPVTVYLVALTAVVAALFHLEIRGTNPK